MTNTYTNKPLVIVGTGLGGYNLAKEFRKIDPNTPLVMITQDEGHFYSKPQLSTALGFGKAPSQLVITDINVMKTQLNANILTHATVIAISPNQQTIQVQRQNQLHEIEYKDLVLALGATPKPFSILDNYPHHYRINNLHEYASFVDNLDNLQSLTIIGSGLVGTEFAHDFVQKGKQVNIVTIDPYPLYNLVPQAVGQDLQKALEKLGVVFYTKAHLQSANADLGKMNLALSSNEQLNTDGVLTAIGLNPNLAIAKDAGLETHQGIIVNDMLQTSVDNIYALGDCVEINGICRQYVAPILQSARALAQTLAGKPTTVNFPITPISLKVSSYPLIICPPNSTGSWQCEHHSDGIKALYHDENHVLQGYALSGSQVEHRQSCLNSLHKAPAVA